MNWNTRVMRVVKKYRYYVLGVLIVLVGGFSAGFLWQTGTRTHTNRQVSSEPPPYIDVEIGLKDLNPPNMISLYCRVTGPGVDVGGTLVIGPAGHIARLPVTDRGSFLSADRIIDQGTEKLRFCLLHISEDALAVEGFQDVPTEQWSFISNKVNFGVLGRVGKFERRRESHGKPLELNCTEYRLGENIDYPRAFYFWMQPYSVNTQGAYAPSARASEVHYGLVCSVLSDSTHLFKPGTQERIK